MKSPCIRVCELDENDVCKGCGRSLEQILNWTDYTKEQREKIIKELNKNKDESYD